MRRRQFITGLGGAAAWSAVGRAQQANRVRRLGVLMSYAENDPEQKTYLAELTDGLAKLGWTDGGNLHMDVRWVAGDVDRVQFHARELVDLQPDVILAVATPPTAAFQRATRTIPIVFVGVSDPVGAGFVSGLPHPGGNLTGFINLEAGMGGKWLELLRQIAPGVTKAAFIFSPETTNASYYMPSFEVAARSLAVKAIAAPVRSAAEIESTIAALGREPECGLIFPPDFLTNVHRALVVSMAARNNLPSVYANSVFVREGGLLSYGPDRPDMFRRSASYVDRILRGGKPADLPVQTPTAFLLSVNLKTAKALGLTVPQALLVSADEVVQ
jgi:putative tryptophan/tyrosine transport system substrate-binding protein